MEDNSAYAVKVFFRTDPVTRHVHVRVSLASDDESVVLGSNWSVLLSPDPCAADNSDRALTCVLPESSLFGPVPASPLSPVTLIPEKKTSDDVEEEVEEKEKEEKDERHETSFKHKNVFSRALSSLRERFQSNKSKSKSKLLLTSSSQPQQEKPQDQSHTQQQQEKRRSKLKLRVLAAPMPPSPSANLVSTARSSISASFSSLARDSLRPRSLSDSGNPSCSSPASASILVSPSRRAQTPLLSAKKQVKFHFPESRLRRLTTTTRKFSPSPPTVPRLHPSPPHMSQKRQGTLPFLSLNQTPYPEQNLRMGFRKRAMPHQPTERCVT